MSSEKLPFLSAIQVLNVKATPIKFYVNCAKCLNRHMAISVKLHLRDVRPSVRPFVRSFFSLSVVSVRGVHPMGRTNRDASWKLNFLNPGSTKKYTKFGQLIVRKFIKIIANRGHILKLRCSKFDSRRLSVRPSVRPFVFDTVDESQRRWHGVTAAIAVDVVAVRVCPSVRLLDGGWHLSHTHTHTHTHTTVFAFLCCIPTSRLLGLMRGRFCPLILW